MKPSVVSGLALWSLAWTGWADDIDTVLERNMRVYSHAPASQRLAAEPTANGQAEMMVYDSLGRMRSRQRVALGATPPPPNVGDKAPPDSAPPLTEYPRNPTPPKPKYEIGYSLVSGYREDRLNWNIAASSHPPYYHGNPNVLSELKWENINIAQIGGKAEITSPNGWHFQGKVGYGFVSAGENQDSDYAGNGRSHEFSRSNNAANEGHTLDASIGAGYRFAWRDEDGKALLSAIPVAGYSYHEQNLAMRKGMQTVSNPSDFWCRYPSDTPCAGPRLGPFFGLDSRYSTQWHGPWLGLKAAALPFDWLDVYGQFEYHWANYYAKANWNLRQDFAHPYSFKHYADGQGLMAEAGLRFRLALAWALELNAFYTAMQTDSGTDTTYFRNGLALSTRLNKAQWDSWGANAGIRYKF